jgi:dolichyl-phosphate-mannose-protein mannosyltransferase
MDKSDKPINFSHKTSKEDLSYDSGTVSEAEDLAGPWQTADGSAKELKVHGPKLQHQPFIPEAGTAEKSQIPRFIALSTLTVLSLLTRLHQIEIPEWVCWDETHFGKMASWYINRTFFFDVHPPLGKMSISLAGYLTGYNGSFAWDKPGDHFDDHSYLGMRIYCAVLGALLVPLVFETVYSLSRSVKAAIIAAACVLFDTGLITLTR